MQQTNVAKVVLWGLRYTSGDWQIAGRLPCLTSASLVQETKTLGLQVDIYGGERSRCARANSAADVTDLSVTQRPN